MNGTYREILWRIKRYRKRSGRDYDAVWIDAGVAAMLPQSIREAHFAGWRPPKGPLVMDGVPVRIHQVLDPIQQ